MPQQSFRTAMVSIIFYDKTINVVDNPWKCI